MSGGRSGTLLRWNQPAWLKSHTFFAASSDACCCAGTLPWNDPAQEIPSISHLDVCRNSLGPSKSLDSFKAAPNFRHQAPVSPARVFAGEERCLLQEEDGDAARQERGHARAEKKRTGSGPWICPRQGGLHSVRCQVARSKCTGIWLPGVCGGHLCNGLWVNVMRFAEPLRGHRPLVHWEPMGGGEFEVNN